MSRIRLDHRDATVHWRMPLGEFREHVEWLESIAAHDGATRDLRTALDQIDPSVAVQDGEQQ